MRDNNQNTHSSSELKIVLPIRSEFKTILTDEAMVFLLKLVKRFESRISNLMEQRQVVQERIDRGDRLDFLEETKEIREKSWNVAPIPNDLLDRRVEITGPVDRKLIINAMNSGANVFMADFEDSNSPTWINNIQGQLNLKDTVRKDISFTNLNGKVYRLNEKTAVLMVRPRGFHLKEQGLQYQDRDIPASLVDFGLFFFHNAVKLVEQGTAPYFYLPKLQDHKEARLWNDIFVFAQEAMEIPNGTIRATVLIEHILAAFQMDEILYELRNHSAGLNCGRWDYIFSFIKTFSKHPKYILPDRAKVTMQNHFLSSYVNLLIATCHKRNIHAMGGMAAQIPIKNDPQANEEALQRVIEDKVREAKAGHDGTWVAHPGLIGIAKTAFDDVMITSDHNFGKLDVEIRSDDLTKIPSGTITENGIRTNINVGLRYLASWLNGNGCVPIFNLMEDAATAEISRSQLWQWVNYQVFLEDGRKVTKEFFMQLLVEEETKIEKEIDSSLFTEKLLLAKSIFEDMTFSKNLPEFLTLYAYNHLNKEIKI